ncbi:MAG TPA: Rnase Y domain-containing protein, partial [Candidatus Eisenbacteria bacterium]
MNPEILLGGALVGAAVAFWLGTVVRARLGRSRLQGAERQAQSLLEQAGREAESVKRNALLEGREEVLHARQQFERETQVTRNNQLATERAFQEKEAAFNRRVELIEKKERDLKKLETDLGLREGAVESRGGELDRLFAEQTQRLERIAGMSAKDARAELITSIESDARAEAAKRVAEIRETAQRNAEREARKVIALAIQRYAGDHVSESAVSV